MSRFVNLFTFLLLFACIHINAQESEGIIFFEGSWEDVLAEAQKTNKPIFLDAYASWCGPCKKMNKEVFPQASVGNYFNDKYISVKIDMEKGEGPELAKKYGVKVYPTFLFINGEGDALHKAAGFRPSADFVELAQNAMNEDKQFYALKTKYDAGDKSKEVLYNYARAMYGSDAYYQSGSVADEYLQQLNKKELKGKKAMDMVMDIPITHDGFAAQQLLENRKKYVKSYTTEKIDNKFLGMMRSKVNMAAAKNDVKALEEAMAFLSENVPAKADKWNGKLAMNFYQQTENWKTYAKEAEKFAENHAMDDSEMLNNISWTFFETIEDKDLLAKAVKWADRSIELEKNYYNTDTKAALLYKMGEYDEALTATKIAIEQAQKEEMDPKETLHLLTKITYNSGLGLEYILANKDLMEKSLGKENAQKSTKKLLYSAAYHAGKAKDMTALQSALVLVKEHYPKKAESMTASMTLEYYGSADDWDNYVGTATAYIEEEGGMDDWNLLNTVAWGFYENIEDKALLEKALSWSNRSVEIDENYYNIDTQAALLYKLGKHQDALMAAKTALELAEKEGIEAKETQELMKKLENLEP